MDRLLTQEEVADQLRVSANTLRIWRSKGGGPRFVKVGRKPAYRASDIEAWVAERTRTETVGRSDPLTS